MNEKLARALSHIDGRYIAAAAEKKKKRRKGWLIAVAAVLTLAMVIAIPNMPLAVTAKAVSRASDARKLDRPRYGTEEFDLWREQNDLRNQKLSAAKLPLAEFSGTASSHILSGTEGENAVWSPLNAYLALGMTAELAAGHTRQDLLQVLGVDSVATMRNHAAALWETVYEDNGLEICVPASSVWLDKDLRYHREVMDVLAYDYYASVYQGQLGSDRTNRDITNWLNNQTGGFLKDRTGQVSLVPNSMLALVSTIYFQGQWDTKFAKENNTQGLFHAPGGDVPCTYMNARLRQMNYYWDPDFSAVRLSMENGSTMWLILPDEDKTVDDVLQRGSYMDLIANTGAFPKESSKWMKVNLSLPQFDISADTDLEPGLSEMGLEEIFCPVGNDFSAGFDTDLPVYLDNIRQSTRVAIDEEGVTAASYILLQFGAGSAEPPEEIIDFVLDRPFLFAITSSSVPLFVGVVNTP